jgi:adhesin/invasin
VPAAIEAVEGEGQTGTVFQPVSTPPAVRVVTGKGKPVKGEEVVFSVASGGGRVSGNAATSDGEGIARVGSWILGTAAGEQSLQASVAGLPLLTITATAEPAAPARITIQAGDDQTGVVGQGLDTRRECW